jgi:cyclopropane fatty-acyl-phospholipid synthase-like methyltransferase
MSLEGTKESQYNYMLELMQMKKRQFGLVGNAILNDDPKRLVFLLSRYKFVSKLFENFDHVLEIGCGDGTGSIIVKQAVKNLTAVDFDPIFIENAIERQDEKWPINFQVHDIMQDSLPNKFDGIFALDVLEHIPKDVEDLFIENSLKSLKDTGVCIFGMPSIQSQLYASKASKEGHVNCKSGDELKTTLKKYFYNVFIFSMNDEVVHTGFTPMAQYLFAVCANLKESN